MLVEELQKIVRGQPPLSPAIARRLLSHFRQGPGGMGGLAEPGLAGTSGFQSSRPMPLGRGAPLDHERLTPRESEVLTYLSKGFTIKEIANLMGIKWFTVNDHIKSIYKKLNVSSRAEAAVLASKQGLVYRRSAPPRKPPWTCVFVVPLQCPPMSQAVSAPASMPARSTPA